MYIEITPDIECSPPVQYLDGNLVSPVEADILLCYLDGNPRTNYKYTAGYDKRYIRPVNNLFNFEKAALASVFFGPKLKQFPMITLFDGNVQLVENTMFHWTSGDTCDGNQPARPVGEAVFFYTRRQQDVLKEHVGLVPVSEPKASTSSYDASIALDMVFTRGPVFELMNFNNYKRQLLNRMSSTQDSKLVDPTGPGVRQGLLNEITSKNLPGIYNFIGPIDNAKTLYGPALERASFGERILYRLNGQWLDPAEVNIARAKYAITDGTGNIYNDNGIVISNVKQYNYVVYNKEPFYKYALGDKTEDFDYTNFYLSSGEHPEWCGEPQQDPPPLDRQLQPPFKYTDILLRRAHESWTGSTIDYRANTYYTTKKNFEYITVGFKLSSGNYAYSGWGRFHEVGKDYLFGRIVAPETRHQEAVLSGPSAYLDYYQFIPGRLFDRFPKVALDIPEVYLFDPKLLKDFPYTEDGKTLELKSHTEYRLKGLVLFNDGVYWCVLEHLIGYRYSITKKLEAVDYKGLKNRGLFVVIEHNKVLTK